MIKHVTFCDLREDCVTALAQRFDSMPSVDVVKRDITKLKTDAWATAGDSFGDMGGGVDRAIDLYFDGHAQNAVRAAIQKGYFGELPVGTAVFVRPKEDDRALIYAPTMRAPGLLPNGTINAYLAMRAILIVAHRADVETIACPTLGVGVGGMLPEEAVEQMYQAYRLVALDGWRQIRHMLQAPFIMK